MSPRGASLPNPCMIISHPPATPASPEPSKNSRSWIGSPRSRLRISTPQRQRSAEAVADLLCDSGVSRVRLLEIEGAHPAVYGVVEGPAGTPTVLVYAHHDFQPPGPAEEWDSAPFEATERDSRLSGCGQRTTRPGWSSTPQRFVHSTVRSLWA